MEHGIRVSIIIAASCLISGVMSILFLYNREMLQTFIIRLLGLISPTHRTILLIQRTSSRPSIISDFRDAVILANRAEDLIDELNQTIANMSGPIVVGGIGDSGTRGVWALLSQLGVYMGNSNTVNRAKDSRIWMQKYKVQLLKQFVQENPHDVYPASIRSTHSLSYNRTTLHDMFASAKGDETWFAGIQLMAETIMHHFEIYKTASSVFQILREKNDLKKFLWGFKHPRTLIMLPYLHAVLGSNFKVIHVFRDARDVALGDNQRMFNGLCKDYFTPEDMDRGFCSRNSSNRLRFWARLNLDIINWSRLFLGPNKYLPVRTEDFVKGDIGCFESTPMVQHSISYNSSFNGNKWDVEAKEEITTLLHQVPEAVELMEMLGYNLDPVMGVKSSCRNLSAIISVGKMNS